MPKEEEKSLAVLERAEQLEFLRGIRDREFGHHEEGVARINNGSFGCCPTSVRVAQNDWKERWLKQPDTFVYSELDNGLMASRLCVAELIHALRVEEVMLVDNATTAAAIVAQDLVWAFLEGKYQTGDAILLLNHAYGSIKNCFESTARRIGAYVIYAKIPFPVASPSHSLECLENALERSRKEDGTPRVIRLAVIDHITSMPTMLLPVKEMVSLCRRYGVEQVFVDGAHAFGSVQVDVQEVDADFYTSNLHKWFFSPTGVAFFHCKARHLQRLHHPIVSSTHGQGLAAECSWVGTRDYSAQLAIPAALEFVNRVGGGLQSLRRFNHESVVALGEMLAREWGTHCGAPTEMFASMVMVGLPPVLNIRSFEEGLNLRILLRRDFRIEVPFHYVLKEDQENADRVTRIPGITAYARISHQIFNTLEDYHRLRDAINSLALKCRSTPAEKFFEKLRTS